MNLPITNLGKALADRGDYDRAVIHYQSALKINGRLARAHNNLGNIFAAQKNIGNAIVNFRRALEIAPDLLEAHINLGTALMHKGQLDDAYYHYEKAVTPGHDHSTADKNKQVLLEALSPDQQVQVFFKTAVRFASEKNNAKAVNLFRKILEIDPENKIIYYNISCLYAIQNQKTEAIDWLRKAVAHGYDNWGSLKNDPDMKNIIDEPYVRELIK